MATIEKFEILSGPGKWDLFVAFGTKGVTVKFRVVDQRVSAGARPLHEFDTSVTLRCLRWEDGSGHSWLIEGYTPRGNVKGWYRTDRRTGWLELTDRY